MRNFLLYQSARRRGKNSTQFEKRGNVCGLETADMGLRKSNNISVMSKSLAKKGNFRFQSSKNTNWTQKQNADPKKNISCFRKNYDPRETVSDRFSREEMMWGPRRKTNNLKSKNASKVRNFWKNLLLLLGLCLWTIILKIFSTTKQEENIGKLNFRERGKYSTFKRCRQFASCCFYVSAVLYILYSLFRMY